MKRKIILLLLLLSVTGTINAEWMRFGGGDNHWLVDVMASCRDGAIVGIARTLDPVDVPVEVVDGVTALLPGGTTIIPTLQPTPIFVRVSDDTVREFNYYSYVRLYWTSPYGLPLDPTTAVDYSFDLDGSGQQFLFDVPISDCLIATSYSNIDYIGQLDGFDGKGLFFSNFSTAEPAQVAVDDQNNIYVLESFRARVQKFDPNGNFLLQWGSPGTANGQFDFPRGIDVDSNGNVYVADTNNNRVQIFDSVGNYLGQLTPPAGQEYNAPQGVTVRSDGVIYVADSDNGLFKKFNANGSYIGTFGTAGNGAGEFVRPEDLAFDSAGFMYVVDPGIDEIKKYNSSEAFVTEWSFNLSTPRAIEVASDGSILVADQFYNAVLRFDNTGGSFTQWATGIGIIGPLGLAVDGNGNVIVVSGDNQTVFQIRYSDQTVLHQWGVDRVHPGQFQTANDVAVDAENNVYVVDQDNHRIQKFDRSGNFLTQWGSDGSGNGQFGNAWGIAVDPAGYVYVSDSALHRIQKFDLDGNYIMQWGGPGAGNGQFNAPYGIGIDGDGNVYVADGSNHRIQKFNSGGTYITQWGSLGSGNSQFTSPADVAIDSAGNVYVADFGNDRVQKFNQSGNYISTIGSFGTSSGLFNDPISVAVDARDFLYVVDQANLRVQRFDNNGNFLTEFAEALSDDFSAVHSDALNFPVGMIVDSLGRVYVADSLNDRVMYYEQLDAPTANDDSYLVELNTPLFIPAPGVLANDMRDVFNDPLSAVLVSDVSNGTLILGGNGSFVYSPDENFAGIDTFTYVASDGPAQSNLATVTLTIPLVANDDTYFVNHGAPLTVTVEDGVLSNDTVPSGGTLSINVDSDVSHGTLALNNDGSFTYTPDGGYGGIDLFTYNFSDGTSTSNTAQVKLHVGYPLSPAPTTLDVTGNLDQPPIRPTFTWGHQTEAGQQEAPGEWYNIELLLNDTQVIFNAWFPVAQVCDAINCSLTPGSDLLPVGLLNGNYAWRVRSWANGIFSEWSIIDTFVINVPAADFPGSFVAHPNQGRPSIEVTNDPYAIWYQVFVGNSDYVHLQWYEKTGCAGLTCTFTLDAHPQTGTYEVWINAWGPGGFGEDNNGNEWSGPEPLSISFPAPAPVAGLTVTHANSGRPTFTWPSSAGATWYQIWVGAPDFSSTAYLNWHSALDMGCVKPGEACTLVPPLVLNNNTSYVWYVRVWGPGGFSSNAQDGWVAGAAFQVSAGPTGTPAPLTPSGTINTASPTFYWQAVENASWYHLSVSSLPPAGAPAHDNWYPAEALGCFSEPICQIKINNLYLNDGTYFWYVQAYSPGGLGGNSNIQIFVVDR